MQPTQQQLDFLVELINEHPAGLIICGPRCPTGDFPTTVGQLAEKAGYPILADPLSGLRFGSFVNTSSVIGGYENFLQSDHSRLPEPNLILRFGSVPTSKWLNNFLDNIAPAYHIHLQEILSDFPLRSLQSHCAL